MAAIKEKRRSPRIDSKNSVGYVLYNEMKKKVDQGTGHTINLSQSGLLLGTKKILNGSYILLITIDLEGKKIKVKGEVVVSRFDETSSRYLTGIKFIGPRDEQLEAVVSFVKSYHYRKHQNGREPAAFQR